jgi:flagellar biosynthetic protein FliP
MVLNYRGVDTSEPSRLTTDDVDMVSLIPAFMLSELKTGFLIGFKVYLPFLVIDIVISSLLISMGMMMLPPVLISLPFKLLLFVLVDGWQLVVGSLLQSFVTRPLRAPPPLPPGAATTLLTDPALTHAAHALASLTPFPHTLGFG